MTTERSSFDDPGVDAIVATREDEFTATGLDDTPRSGAGETTSRKAGSGDRLSDAAGSVAGRVADSAQEAVGTKVDTGLSRAGDVLDQVAGAVRQGGEQLRMEQPQIAGFADTAAQQVERVAGHLRTTDFEQLRQEAEDFARRQPAAFLGGAFALGLIASRFLKASPEAGSSYRGARGEGYGYGSAYRSGAWGRGYADDAWRAGGARYRDPGSAAATGYGAATAYGSGTTADAGTGAEHGGS